MPTTNQIYGIINSIRKQALGDTISVVDATTFMSFGDMVLSSATNKEKFYNALMDRVGKTIIAVRDYEPKRRKAIKDENSVDAIIQKIHYTMSDATNDNGWNVPSDPVGGGAFAQADPYDVTSHVTAYQKLFYIRSAWSHEEMIPDFQLRTAFLSSDKMGLFISGIYTTLQNALSLELESLGNLAVATAIAKTKHEATKSNGNMNCYRDLLTEYNENVLGLTLTSEGYPVGWVKKSECMQNKDFLLYASKEINRLVSNVGNFSKNFNVGKHETFSTRDRVVVELLSEFGIATQYYSESSTYHKNLVELPNYESVDFWQGSGSSFAFDDTSSIKVKVASNQNEELSGVIGYVHDIDTVFATLTDRRTTSLYNPRNEVNNVFMKANKGFGWDSDEVGVVLYVSDKALPVA